MHSGDFLIRHDRVAAHKVDALKDSHAAALQTLELYRLLVFAILILLHIDNIVRKFNPEARLSQNAGRILLVYSTKEEVMRATSLDDLALVLIIEGQVEIAQTGLSVQSGADVGQEGTNRGNVDGIPNLLGEGDGSDGHDVAGQEQIRYEVGDRGPGRAVEDVADPQNGLEDGMADGEEDPKVEGGAGIGPDRLRWPSSG